MATEAHHNFLLFFPVQDQWYCTLSQHVKIFLLLYALYKYWFTRFYCRLGKSWTKQLFQGQYSEWLPSASGLANGAKINPNILHSRSDCWSTTYEICGGKWIFLMISPVCFVVVFFSRTKIEQYWYFPHFKVHMDEKLEAFLDILFIDMFHRNVSRL